MELVKCYYSDGSHSVKFRDKDGRIWCNSDGTCYVSDFTKIEPLFPKMKDFTKWDLQDRDICVRRDGNYVDVEHIRNTRNHDLTGKWIVTGKPTL